MSGSPATTLALRAGRATSPPHDRSPTDLSLPGHRRRPERAEWFPSEEEARGAIERLLGKHPDAEIEREERAGHGVHYCLKPQGLWLDSRYLRAGRSPGQILALDAKAEAREPVGPVTFIGTFQRWHYHPNTGQNLRGGHVEFQVASGDDANALMWYAFGDDGWTTPTRFTSSAFFFQGFDQSRIA